MNNTRIYFNNELVLLKELELSYYIYPDCIRYSDWVAHIWEDNYGGFLNTANRINDLEKLRDVLK
ncbi:hypothetical protein RIR_e22375_A0A2I1EG19_9GLOM [Rhizophagus irregularis DAOM 181602=DAOM 197198]|nr:hypothetical protein RhiirB3_434560 [Rhizophagus irregularis]GET55525.1 hypothetical protein RIR_e22375_A0A2I1EG19_9GLOM [Rhizophagus irregularis DAOM 181602=DAOM 197198]